MTPQEPPRRPKPITKAHGEEVAQFFHTAWTTVSREARPDRVHMYPEWEGVPEDRRRDLTDAAYKLLDGGWVVNLTADETMAVVECLMEAGVTWDSSDGSPVDPIMRTPLLTAFHKLSFANGRHYGLTNFDMGIEEDT